VLELVAGCKCWTQSSRRLHSQALALRGAIPGCTGSWLSCNGTATATATRVIQRGTLWYHVNNPSAATPTELTSLTLHDTPLDESPRMRKTIITIRGTGVSWTMRLRGSTWQRPQLGVWLTRPDGTYADGRRLAPCKQLFTHDPDSFLICVDTPWHGP
jgi:hypothetical protein